MAANTNLSNESDLSVILREPAVHGDVLEVGATDQRLEVVGGHVCLRLVLV